MIGFSTEFTKFTIENNIRKINRRVNCLKFALKVRLEKHYRNMHVFLYNFV